MKHEPCQAQSIRTRFCNGVGWWRELRQRQLPNAVVFTSMRRVHIYFNADLHRDALNITFSVCAVYVRLRSAVVIAGLLQVNMIVLFAFHLLR